MDLLSIAELEKLSPGDMLQAAQDTASLTKGEWYTFQKYTKIGSEYRVRLREVLDREYFPTRFYAPQKRRSIHAEWRPYGARKI